jgi:DNA-binding LytR/AlgR family response regulator
MPTALLADDEPHLLRHLEAMLGRLWPELVISHRARNGLEAAALIAAHAPDVAFLDIRMPGLDGLAVAQGIEGPTRVVFVTAYDAHAVEAFEREALDYVLKPLQEERLARCVARVRRALAPAAGADAAAPTADAHDGALARALQQLLARPPAPPTEPPLPRLRQIRASRCDLTTVIPVDAVLAFHADEKYTAVVTADSEHLIRTPIADLLQQLDPQRFAQVHRSTVVNLDAVASTRRDDQSRLFLRLRGLDREWPVSRAYVHLFRPM